MEKFLILGPITRDTIINRGSTCRGIGGPIYYQAAVLGALELKTTVLITLGKEDADLLDYFPAEVQILTVWGEETMHFENLYPDDDPNHRMQKAFIPQNPFKVSHFSNINLEYFSAIVVSPLSPHDIPLKTIEYLSQFNLPIYLGLQGYLRYLDGDKVVLKPWNDHKSFLRWISYLFLDEVEARVLMGERHLSLEEVAINLSLLGPEEVIITRGDRGSLIYSRETNTTYRIPAFPSLQRIDPTGLGDTYLAAYAIKRQESKDPLKCGVFASIVSSMKLEKKGAFRSNQNQVDQRIHAYKNLIEKIK
jgi:sugar/nucleoside kinase (ribokinase family)